MKPEYAQVLFECRARATSRQEFRVHVGEQEVLVPKAPSDISDFVGEFEKHLSDPEAMKHEESPFEGSTIDSESFAPIRDQWLVGFVITAAINDVFASALFYDGDISDFIKAEMLTNLREEKIRELDWGRRVLAEYGGSPFKFIQEVTGCSAAALEASDLLSPEWVTREVGARA